MTSIYPLQYRSNTTPYTTELPNDPPINNNPAMHQQDKNRFNAQRYPIDIEWPGEETVPERPGRYGRVMGPRQGDPSGPFRPPPPPPSGNGPKDPNDPSQRGNQGDNL